MYAIYHFLVMLLITTLTSQMLFVLTTIALLPSLINELNRIIDTDLYNIYLRIMILPLKIMLKK